jgi:hypothetical protein
MTKRPREEMSTIGLFSGLGEPQQPPFYTLPDDLKRKAECTGPRFLCIEWEEPGNRLLRKPKPSNITWREVPSQKMAEAIRDRLEEVALCRVSIHDHLPPPPEAVDLRGVYEMADAVLEETGLKKQRDVWLKTLTGDCAYPGCYASATWERTQWFSRSTFTKRDDDMTHRSCNEHKSKFGFND